MNYLPELRCAMVDAARHHYHSTAVPARPTDCRPSRFRRVPGGRPLALIGVLVLGSASGALAAAGGPRVPAPVPSSSAAVTQPVPQSSPVAPVPVPSGRHSVTRPAPQSKPVAPVPVPSSGRHAVTRPAPQAKPVAPVPVPSGSPAVTRPA